MVNTELRLGSLPWDRKQDVWRVSEGLTRDHIQMLLHGAEWGPGRAPVPAVAPARAPKIAFMFLTRGAIPLESVWDRFFKVNLKSFRTEPRLGAFCLVSS